MITYKVALYSSWGGRKTLQIRHLIERFGPENVRVVSADRGEGLATIQSIITDEMVIRVTNLKEMRAAWAACSKIARHDLWICIDGGTHVVQWIANEQLSGAEAYYDAKARNEEISDRIKPFGRFLTSSGAIETRQVYNRIGRDSENLWSAWLSLPANLYVNFLEDKTGHDGSKSILPYGPDVPGKVGLDAVMSGFDFTMRLMYDADGVLVAQLDEKKNRVYLSKTRNDRTVVELPPEIPNFNLAAFVDLISGTSGRSGQKQEAAVLTT